MNTLSECSQKKLLAGRLLVIMGLAFSTSHFVMAAPVSLPKRPLSCDDNTLRAFPEMPSSLKCTPAPEPYMLDEKGKKLSIYPGIIKNKVAAIALGKMLFWDSMVGSDGIACASCHFQAGADNRTKNQINPGSRNASGKLASDGKTPINNVFDFMSSNPNSTNLDALFPASGKGANYTLKKADFPLRQYKEPEVVIENLAVQNDRNAEVIYDSDDIVSSQGVFYSHFNSLTPSGIKENCTNTFPTSGPDMPLFNVGGNAVRQVEPRNTPTVINAVYNFRNFWDGRANNVFNGLDPFGMRRFADPTTTPSTEIYSKDGKGKLVKKRIAIFNASLASQALGPALSDFEMSCGGKTFADLGRKMLSLKPLIKQTVDPSDSVLGSYAKPGSGLKPAHTYKSLVQAAFNDVYWNVPDSQKIVGYTLAENNFSLFWGLAVQAYEATLVSDNSRFDQAQEDPSIADTILTDQERHGMNLFVGNGKCIACHLGGEFTSASVSHVENSQNVTDIGKYVQRMIMGDGGVALYDDGFYNIGVRPTEEDLGVGATDGYGFPLSFSRNAKRNANNPQDYSIENANITRLAPDLLKTDSTFFAQNVGCMAWNPDTTASGYFCGMDPIVSDERDAVDGAFKTSSLRNIELTGPYMHNGGQATLEQVVYFYNRGGDRKDSFLKDLDCGNPLFINDIYGNSVVAPDSETGLIDNSGFKPLNGGNASNMAADMAGHRDVLDVTCNVSRANHETLNLSTSDVNDLVAFMKTLTDERVRWEQAPFDHPSLVITNGTVGDENKLNANVLKEQTILLPAVGAKGRKAKRMAELKSFESGLK